MLTSHYTMFARVAFKASPRLSTPFRFAVSFHTTRTMAADTRHKAGATSEPEHFMFTEGGTDSVWSHGDPYDRRPSYSKLIEDLRADVAIVGAGIVGISTAYELVKRRKSVVMLEAREVLSGETDRTSGHLSSALDDWYTNIQSKHGHDGASTAYESHKFALEHVGEIAKELKIDCEYRILPAYEVSAYRPGEDGYEDDVKSMKDEVGYDKSLGIPLEYHDKLAVPGWKSDIDQRAGILWQHQATFNPVKYLLGVMKWLNDQPDFAIYTHTRVADTEEKGGIPFLTSKHVDVTTDNGHTVTCKNVIADMEYNRTYCVALRIPRDSYTDCLVYDTGDPYNYVRFAACDDKDDYLVIGGADHKVGQTDDESTRFAQVEKWARDRWPQCGALEYQWSGQIYDPHDYVAFIGLNPGTKRTWIATGDSGNGLTHGVLGARIIADGITGEINPWQDLYSPKRVTSLLTSAVDIVKDNPQDNMHFKRWAQTDIKDIEDLGRGEGGVLNKMGKKPWAVYKDEDGQVRTLSAICPHMKGIVCWNHAEKSWDCPVHGSRFSTDGVCVTGPAKSNLNPECDSSRRAQEVAAGG
ncbi:hypothetical protein KVT40_006250 [Elsinoe batatas]|uniref:Rieske domain-containing protein n=1 Tax=Elsinoe batatas TaxID=2601811 RepID=A0A8K0KXL2_9PEZI|nr:hypothetical protein KVT40_006250 [Elsinoe batatas]